MPNTSADRGRQAIDAAMLCAALLFSDPTLTWAQAAATPADERLEEIVVTAERRESTVQNIAGSVTAISGDQVMQRGFTDFSSLAATIPGLSSATGGPGQTEYELRGVVNSGGNSPTTGFYLDDTPLTAAANSNSGKAVIDPNLYDISRVEVLRGPQGTLYGSSSMGGTIKIITNQPNTEDFRASANAKLSDTQGGSFNHTESGMVNIPLVRDKVALRVVASEDTTSGWIDRIVVAPGAFPSLVAPPGVMSLLPRWRATCAARTTLKSRQFARHCC